MGKIITVMNMKGGVGKSTVSMHIAGMLGRYEIEKKRRKVLMIDYDPQFNLTQAFIPAQLYFQLEDTKRTALSILVDDPIDLNPYELQVPGNANPPKCDELVYKYFSNKSGNELHLIPSTLDLMYIALGQSLQQLKPMEERFSKFIDECRARYDLVFIDCHPAGSIFTKTSLQNSDHVLIPVVPQKFAIRGIGLMKQFISAKKQGGKAPVPHILFNHVPRAGTLAIETSIRADPNFSNLCLSSSLKYYKAFSEPEYGKGFVWSSKKPYSSEAFHNLLVVTTEFAKRIGA